MYIDRSEGETSTIEITVSAAEELARDESRVAMSHLISDRLGIGREEFLAKLDAGEYNTSDEETVLQLVTLAPFAR